MEIKGIKEEIERLKAERNALILAHNYQRAEVQEIADYVGDSLDMARFAAESEAQVLVVAGVRFMAEVAKILSPEKTVLLPVPDAGCPLAESITPEDLKALKAEHPNAKAVAYVNTYAELKAVAHAVATSRNAVDVVSSLDADEVIFVPDKNLGEFVRSKASKKVILWKGYCYVHAGYTLEEVRRARQEHPGALVVVHPEVPPEVQREADYVLSTGGMVQLARESEASEFIIGTEEGLITRLRREFPQKRFWPLGAPRVCQDMKKITVQDVYKALKEMVYPVELPPEVAEGARRALEAMFKLQAVKSGP